MHSKAKTHTIKSKDSLTKNTLQDTIVQSSQQVVGGLKQQQYYTILYNEQKRSSKFHKADGLVAIYLGGFEH